MTEQGLLTERELVRWLQSYLAELLDIEAHEVSTELPLDSLGVDSATALVLSADLGAHTGRLTRPFEVLDHPTVADLARHVAAAPAVVREVGS